MSHQSNATSTSASASAEEESEKIRLKRIAKLNQTNPPHQITPTNSTQTNPTNQTQKSAPIPASSSVPKKINTQTSKPISKLTSLNPEQLKKWEHDFLSHIFKITLKNSIASQSQWTQTYLPELERELEDESQNSTEQLSMEIADRLLIARLSLDSSSMTDDPIMATIYASLPNQSPFEYLSSCWIRTIEERSKVLASKSSVPERLQLIDQAKNLIISYTGLAMQDPSMFPNNKTPPEDMFMQLCNLLTNPPPSHPLTPHIWLFIHELTQRFQDDGLEDIIGPVISHISLQNNLRMALWHLGGHEWRAPVRILVDLMELKPIAKMVTRLPEWLPSTPNMLNGKSLEVFCLLGPVLALSTFPDRAPVIAEEYFKNSKERPRSDLDSATTSLQQTLNSLHLSLYTIFDRIVRAGPEPRESVLQFWAQVIQLNLKRAAMQVDPAIVSSDGFIINTQAVLLQFAGPFLDPQFSKIDKVDPLYFKHSKRLNIMDETKISATKEESDAFLTPEESNGSTPVNFISEIFFLNVAIFRLGILSVAKNWDTRAREIEDMKKEVNRLKEDRRWDGTPMLARVKATIEKFELELSSREAKLTAYEVQMCDPEFLTKCNSFCSFVMTWCVRMVDPTHQHPKVPIKLPLPQDCPLAFRMLPEYVLEDVIEFYSFISRHSPPTLLRSSAVIDELLTFTLVFLTTPYLKNFHLKSKFIEILYFNIRPIPGRPNGVLGDALNYHPMSLSHLMSALMQIYVEVEITGSHSQFYDKFYSRRYIALILRKVWNNQTHRRALKKESTTESFIRFANLLMNDVTYLLDETLRQLQDVNRIESKMADQAAWMALPESERKDEESKLHSYERQCPPFLSLANENVNMLKTFTEETPDAFLKSEIVVRLAAMLDYNLETLAGSRCQSLKVKDPDKFNFHPKRLLSDILQVYLNLSNRIEFQQAISDDGRSYSKELFQRADRIARKASLKTDDELNQFKVLVEKIEELRKREAEAEEELGEVPEEFLDPVMATLMKDPVILPSSRTTVDRSTIKQHFLSDQTDPFNRMPLRLEDLIPDLELQSRITTWLRQKKEERQELK
ncbi:ubiquitin elongating factor core-domain-containing protein [Melampsora americana]|nr:ubiquitin elongating factor core-domain-containing protein [Melampsora americana]